MFYSLYQEKIEEIEEAVIEGGETLIDNYNH